MPPTSDRLLRALPMPAGPAVVETLPLWAEALAGAGPAWLPVPSGDTREGALLRSEMSADFPIGASTAAVTATSGTTGTPKGAQLSGAALRASAAATHTRLGGPGTWLLALPTHHVAGLQVLLRSVAAGTEPVVVDVSDGFDPLALPAAVAAMGGPRHYTSLVPTQLVKALTVPAATEALAELDAVLVGGAALAPAVRERAAAAGITVVRTYGMSETCGGCVYDGVPLDGVQVRIDPGRTDGDRTGGGRIVLGGPTIASGYRNVPADTAFAEPGWFRTNDVGALNDGVLTVLGRADDAISSGGLTVLPTVVENALMRHPAVRECSVVGVPDERLGEQVVAAVVLAEGTAPTVAELRAHVVAVLDATAAPRRILIVGALPLRGPGKVDRATLRGWFGAP